MKSQDGAPGQRIEFDNSFSGMDFLAKTLGRGLSVGGWEIRLSASPLSDSPFVDAAGRDRAGLVVESGFAILDGPYIFKSLTVSAPDSGPNNHKLVLTGSATAQRDGHITQVASVAWGLNPTEPPSGKYVGSEPDVPFTSKTLSPGVNVLSGQKIDVTVVISFS